MRDPLRLRACRDARDRRQHPGDGSEPRLERPLAGATLVCALVAEERAARRGGARRVARVGVGAPGPLPDGPLISFGLAGALVPGLEVGALVVARRIVDDAGRVLWEGDPVLLPAARAVVLCGAGAVVDDPGSRGELAERTGAQAVDMESGRLAAVGGDRFVGAVRAISDTAARPVGRLAFAAKPDGRVDWLAVARALAAEPRVALGGARRARVGLAALEHAAGLLAGAEPVAGRRAWRNTD